MTRSRTGIIGKLDRLAVSLLQFIASSARGVRVPDGANYIFPVVVSRITSYHRHQPTGTLWRSMPTSSQSWLTHHQCTGNPAARRGLPVLLRYPANRLEGCVLYQPRSRFKPAPPIRSVAYNRGLTCHALAHCGECHIRGIASAPTDPVQRAGRDAGMGPTVSSSPT